MKSELLLVVFVVTSMGATIVNKYVLSVLGFTYPTVYQSWQMGAVFMVVILAHFVGIIQISSIERVSMKQWFPAMCFFTTGIYSGSIALSRLPIPTFFTSFHFVYVSTSIADSLMFKKKQCWSASLGLVLGSVGLISSLSNHPVDFLGHRWMFVHCISSASYTLFGKRFYKGELRDVDKILLNSSFSFVTLLSIGILTGEVSKAFEFLFLYSRNFQYGCLASGITGSLLGLSYSGLANFMSVQRLRWIGSLVMVLTSVVSFAIFPFKTSLPVIVSIATALSGSVVFTYSVWVKESKLEKRSNPIVVKGDLKT